MNNDTETSNYQEAWQHALGAQPCDYFTTTMFESPVSENYIKRVFDKLHKDIPVSHHVWVQQYTPEKLPLVLCTFTVKEGKMLSKENLKVMLEKHGPTEIWDINEDVQLEIFNLMFEQYPRHDNYGLFGY